MGVSVEMAVSGVDWNYAAGTGDRATHVLELHRSVMDVEAIPQHMFYTMEDMIALRWRHIGDEHMATQRVGIRTQTPDMQIVNVENPVYRTNG